MTTRSSPEHAELRAILSVYLLGHSHDALAHYLMEKSNLTGARMNLAVVHAFADVIGELVAQPRLQADRLEALLNDWAAIPAAEAPVNHPRVILPSAAALAYGQVAISRPDWWRDEIAKLRRLATDSRWRVRELVAMALQRMLDADWRRTCDALVAWTLTGEALAARAAAAAVAEPSLLGDRARAEDALAVQAEAINIFINIPPERRRDEDVRSLRQTLGFSLSVVTAASPETGFHLMEELAALPDPDVRWIVRENMKKKRLQAWQDRLDTLETAMFRPEQPGDDE